MWEGYQRYSNLSTSICLLLVELGVCLIFRVQILVVLLSLVFNCDAKGWNIQIQIREGWQ